MRKGAVADIQHDLHQRAEVIRRLYCHRIYLASKQ